MTRAPRAVLLALGILLLALPLDTAAQDAAATPPPTPTDDGTPPPAAGPPPTPIGPPPTPAEPPPPPLEDEFVDDEDDLAEEDEEEDEDHHGFFFRFALGLGWGWITGDGTMAPAKGLQAIEDPQHNSPVFNLALSLGGGFLDLALHLGVLYERMILRADQPEEMGFSLFGIGGGASYYFTEHDFFATLQVRFVGLALFMPEVICDDYYADKWEWYKGPGVALTLGKEWYGDDEGGVGLGIQGNYAYLVHSNGFAFHYNSLLLVLTLTHF